MSRRAQATVPEVPESLPRAPSIPPGLTVAHFTEAELRELRKLCRDAKNSGEGHELCHRYLESALARAAGGGK